MTTVYFILGGVVIVALLVAVLVWQSKKGAAASVKADFQQAENEANDEAAKAKRDVLTDDAERERLRDKFLR